MSKLRSISPRQAACRCGPIDLAIQTELFKALSDPTRRLLFSCIAKCGRSCSVSEVVECCDVDFSVVSRHLALLARSGALESSKEGRVMRYRVRYQHIAAALRQLADAISGCGCNCVEPLHTKERHV